VDRSTPRVIDRRVIDRRVIDTHLWDVSVHVAAHLAVDTEARAVILSHIYNSYSEFNSSPMRKPLTIWFIKPKQMKVFWGMILFYFNLCAFNFFAILLCHV